MAITIHHLNNSRSQRVLWLLEELGLDYEVKRYERDAETMLAPPELKQVHPLGKSPVIEDGGRIYAETGAIVEHLIETYGEGRLVPEKGTPAFDAYRYFLHYAEGSAMPPLLMKLVFTRMGETGGPALLRPITKAIADGALKSFVNPQLENHMRYWEGALAETGWFASGEISGADIMMSFPLEAAATRAGLDVRYPNCKAFLKRIHARPAYQKAIEVGGAYLYGG
ncbi:MAG: glutathione S-transferase [Pseudomonadota bacterium]